MRTSRKKWINLKCSFCGENFNKELREYSREKRRRDQAHFFCSQQCFIPFHSKQRKDSFSKFRLIFKGVIKVVRAKKIEFDLTFEFLEQLWIKQNGKCAYTNIDMILPINATSGTVVRDLSAASLDRIDSSKGYTQDNVEFVCRFINLGKNRYSKQCTIDFLNKLHMAKT